MSISETKIAIIGAGRMGVRHAQAARSLGLEISGIFDANSTRACDAARSVGLPETVVFRSSEELLLRSGASALAVATTADSHHDYVIAGATAGFTHILCEKPMAVSADQCRSMVHTCREAGTRLAVNHQTRLTNRFRVLNENISGAMFGGFTSMVTSAGNLGLAMGASHFIELFRLLSGSPVREVRFISDSGNEVNPRGPSFIDPAGRLLAATDSGERMYMEFGSDQGHGLTSVISGRYGQISMDDLSGSVTFAHRLPSERLLPLTRYGSDALVGAFQMPLEDVVATTARVWQALLNNLDYPTGEQGAYIVSVLAAAEQSALLAGLPVSPVDGIDPLLEYKWA